MESKKINQLATELAPDLTDLTIIGDPITGISKKITLSQMASLFTGTVEEYANKAAFPLVGVADTIYVALDTNVIWRWNTGTSAYVELSPNIINSLVFGDGSGFDGTISLVGSVATLTITTALTTGSVGFIGASGALLEDNTNFFWNNSTKRLGINTNAPTTALDVFGSGIIGRINGTSTNNAFLGFASAGTNKWSVGNVQSDHRFRIYSEANTAELVSVLQTGEFGIGIANPTTKVHIDGGASALIANLDANISVAKSISFRSDNSNRFNLEVSGTESGSNAGADLFIRRYSDAGSLLDTAFYIKRSTGKISAGSTNTTSAAGVVMTLNNPDGGGIQLSANNAGGGFIQGGTGGALDFWVYTGAIGSESGTKKLTLTSTGLGINTITPSSALDIVGSAKITNTSGQTLVLSKGTGASINLLKTDATAQDWSIAGDPNFRIINNTRTKIPFLINNADDSIELIGALGINCTPADILDIRKNQNATTNFYFRNTDNTNGTSRAALNLISGNQTLTILSLSGGGSAGSSYIANTAGADLYFQQSIGGTVNAVIKSDGKFGIGTSSPSNKLDVRNGGDFDVKFRSEAAGGTVGLLLETANTFSGTSQAFIKVIGGSGGGTSNLIFGTAAASGDSTAIEKARLTNLGSICIGKTSYDNSVAGISLTSVSEGSIGSFVTNGGPGILINRLSSDGDLVIFRQDGNTEGTISVSGSTVSYNSFLGSHWSQLKDNLKPEILKGTVLEAIDELCIWENENNDRLAKIKISNTIESKNVYGIFLGWDNDDVENNDMFVAAVGAGYIRINASQNISMGDLLQSNGDGTAKIQSDDIMRSSTIAKVVSTKKIETYEDGSYLIAATLHCG